MEPTGGGPIRGALARLRSAPLWVWITILLTMALVLFAYLQYRKAGANSASSGSSAAQGTVPSDGTGQPMWNTADNSGFVAGNVTDLAALLAYLQSQNTPNPSTTATPTVAGAPILAPGPSGGVKLTPGGGTTPPPPSGTIPQPPGAPTSTAQGGLVTNSTGTYFHISQKYSPTTKGTTTIAGLAHRFNTTVANLLRLNPQVNKSTQTTYVGEWIRIK